MKKKEALKKKIKKIHGSLSNFARLINRDRTELQIIFSKHTIYRPEVMKELEHLCDTTEPVRTKEIPEEKLTRLKSCIDAAGGTYRFSKDNPQFPVRQVYEVYKGERTRVSKLVQLLFDHFKIE